MIAGVQCQMLNSSFASVAEQFINNTAMSALGSSGPKGSTNYLLPSNVLAHWRQVTDALRARPTS